MYGSGAYGLVAEAEGMTLLERSYHGPVVYYYPWSISYSATQLYNGQTEQLSGQDILSVTNLTGGAAWYGPYVSLPPGSYTVSFSLMTTNLSASNSVGLSVATGAGSLDSPFEILKSYKLVGSNFTQANRWSTFGFNVTIPGYLGLLQFAGYYAEWDGTLSIRDVQLSQVGPT
jgi:hypothetical protein